MKAFAAAASSKTALQAAEEALTERGTAADAVAAAWFALAGERSDVFAAPLRVMVSGPAAVGRVFDGRALQAGLGGVKPRGLREDEVIPLASYATVPRSLGAILLLVASFGGRGLTKAIHAGAKAAKANGSKERARLLDRVLASGAATFASFEDEILGVVGRTNGGYLTPSDLAAEASQTAASLHDFTHGESRVQVAEEPNDELAETAWFGGGGVGSETESIVAVDHRGTLAAATFFVGFTAHEGKSLEVPSLGIAWSLGGGAPRHGQPRIKPGTPVELVRTLLSVDAGQTARMAVAFGAGTQRPALDLDGDEDLTAWVRSLEASARVSVLATSNGATGRLAASNHG